MDSTVWDERLSSRIGYTKTLLVFASRRSIGMISSSTFRMLGTSLLLNLLLFGVFFWVGTACYDQNDDIAMAFIASGISSGDPDEHLIFTNVVVGRVLKWLYQCTDAVNWYTVYVAATHMAAATLVLFVLLLRTSSALTIGAYLLLFIQFEVPQLLALQFTSVSMLATSAGMVAILYGPRDKPILAHGTAIVGIAFLVLGCMIRYHAFCLALLLFLPLVTVAVFTPVRLWMATYGSAGLLLAVAAIGYDNWIYVSDPDWQLYRRHYEARVRVSNHVAGSCIESGTDSPILAAALRSVGWSDNDARMYGQWSFGDESVFSTDRLTALAEASPLNRTSLSEASVRAWEVLRSIKTWLTLTVLNCFGAFLLARATWGTRHALATVATGVLGAIVLFYLGGFWRLPLRVALPVLFVVNTSVVFIALCGPPASRSDPRPQIRWPRRWGRIGLSLLLLTYVAVLCRHGQIVIVQDRRNQESCKSFLQIMNKLDEGLGDAKVVVTWGWTFPFEWAPPFYNWKKELKRDWIWLGWPTHSPLYKAAIARNDISNVYQALYQRRDVVLVGNEGHAEMLRTFAWEHYGQRISYVTLVSYRDETKSVKGFRFRH